MPSDNRQLIHDIRNNLTTIVTLAELLQSTYENDTTILRWTIMITAAVDACINNIDELSDNISLGK